MCLCVCVYMCVCQIVSGFIEEDKREIWQQPGNDVGGRLMRDRIATALIDVFVDQPCQPMSRCDSDSSKETMDRFTNFTSYVDVLHDSCAKVSVALVH